MPHLLLTQPPTLRVMVKELVLIATGVVEPGRAMSAVSAESGCEEEEEDEDAVIPTGILLFAATLANNE